MVSATSFAFLNAFSGHTIVFRGALPWLQFAYDVCSRKAPDFLSHLDGAINAQSFHNFSQDPLNMLLPCWIAKFEMIG